MFLKLDPHIMSIDVGTSSVRSKIFNSAGNEVFGLGTQIPYTMTRSSDGGEFINADELFRYVLQAIDHCVEDAKRESIKISAVSCCTFWHNLVGLDDTGYPCTPLLNWSDTRPETILPKLQKKLPPAEFTDRTGCPMHSSYLPAKIMWLHHDRPNFTSRVRYWMSMGEYILFQFFGQRFCSYSMASASGLLNSAECQWDAKTLKTISVEENQLSQLCDVQDGLQGLLKKYSERWPSLKNALWYPALGDGACSNIGCGCTSPERFGLMVGTSGAMRTVWRGEYQAPPKGLWCYRLDRHRPIMGGALSNGGNIFQWLRDSINLPPTEELEDKLKSLKPDSHGLTVLPFFSGQRSPNWNPNIQATIHGLRLSTTPMQILQACLESIAFRFKMIHDLIAPRFSEEHVIVATGGGLLRSPTWIQIMADTLGWPIRISKVSEASCRGAALVALESLGVLEDINKADPCLGATFEPRKDVHEIYQAALQRHIELETKMHS